MQGKQAETKSPLKGKPLRYPGQSLDEEIGRVLDDEVLVWVIMVAFAVLFAALEWFRWAVAGLFHPIVMSIAALALLAIGIRRILKARRKLKALKLGRDGERAVGQYLDAMREKGFRIFHDLIGEGFNVDHVVISPHGVFTVETKTFSKPVGRNATVRVHDGFLTVGGHLPDRNPIDQAKAQAKWVNTVLRESTGKSYAVKPVIVFPGWYVEPLPKGESREVWVLNPKGLPEFIENEPGALTQQDVMLATYHLSRHIRTTN